MPALDSPEGRAIFMRQMAPLGFREHWFEYWGTHLTFESLDAQRDFDAMYRLLGAAEPLRDFLLWHVNMTRRRLGAYAIEAEPAFAAMMAVRGYTAALAEARQSGDP